VGLALDIAHAPEQGLDAAEEGLPVGPVRPELFEPVVIEECGGQARLLKNATTGVLTSASAGWPTRL
jgi:hypothetical protein